MIFKLVFLLTTGILLTTICHCEGTFVERITSSSVVRFSANRQSASSNVECAAICQAQESCESYLFHASSQNCSLGQIVDFSVTGSEADSGLLTVKINLNRSIDNGLPAETKQCPKISRFFDSGLSVTESETVETCSETCHNQTSCGFYMYGQVTKRCVLSTECVDHSKICSTCQLGVTSTHLRSAFNRPYRASWTVTSSGIFPGPPGDYRPINAIDAITGDIDKCFSTPLLAFNWFQADFGETLDSIRAVEVLKRVDMPPHRIPARFRDVIVRVGFEDVGNHPLSLITKNVQCGEFGKGTMEMVAIIFCESSLSGRFLTVQSTAVTFLEFDELEVYFL